VSTQLLVIVPTRSRPHNILPVVEAWLETDAFDTADLLFGIDYDDPARDEYLYQLHRAQEEVGDEAPTARLRIHQSPRHEQLVPKLNSISGLHAGLPGSPFAVGFAGDDHRPRTRGWAGVMLGTLREMRTGIVYPDDGYQGENIPTSWVMTADIARILGGRQVPAPVEHLFCDNAVRDLGRAAGCLQYLPEVLVEHMHPNAPGGKAPSDEQYERVNAKPQWRADRRTYREWRAHDLPRQAAEISALMTTGEAT
jgi:hypothetical protein